MDDVGAAIEQAVLAAIAGDAAVTARALHLVLRRYASGAYAEVQVQNAIGRALAAALDAHTADETIADRAAWIELFVEAAGLSDDVRLPAAVATLTGGLRQAWTAASVGERCTAIGGCLDAARLPSLHALAADAVDALERTIAGSYEPGEHFGSFADQVRAASALLAGYRLSGRLPYSMLAEELMQIRTGTGPVALDTACEAARVLCRLAALHDDPQYHAAAVLVSGADYRADAARLLRAHEEEAARRGAAAAIYALARLELESGRL